MRSSSQQHAPLPLGAILVAVLAIAPIPACAPAGNGTGPLADRALSVQASNLPLGAVASWMAGELKCGVFVEASLQNTVVSYFNQGARLPVILDELKGMAGFEYEISENFIILYSPGASGRIVGSIVYSAPAP